MEVAVAATLIAMPFLGWWLTRRATYVLLCGILGVALTGLIVEVTDAMGVDWTRSSLTGAVIASQIGLAVHFVLTRDVGRSRSSDSLVHSIGLPLFLCILLIIRLWTTHPKFSANQSGVIIDLSFFTSGEDNAKWLNVLSRMTQGEHISVSGVGGLFVVLSTISWIVARALISVFSLSWNEQSLTLNALFFLSLGPIVLSPFALVPMLESRPDEKKWYPRVLVSLPSMIVLAAMVANVRPLGHVSTEIVIVVLTFGMTTVASDRTSNGEALMGYLLVGLGSTVWLGLRFVPILILLLLLAIWYTFGAQLRIPREHALAGFAVLLVALYPAWTTFRYARSTTSTLGDLFAASGALVTVATSTTLLALGVTIVGLLGVADSSSDDETRFRNLLPASLLAYTLFILWNDVARTTKINYGSLKLWYIVVAILLASYLTPCLLFVGRRASRFGVGHTMGSVAVGILLIVSLEGVLTRPISDLNSGIWAGASTSAEGTYLNFVRTTTDRPQDLDGIPVGCVQYAKDGTMLTSTDTYVCTRVLSSFAGLEDEANPLQLWQLVQFRDTALNPAQIWAKSRPWLDGLPEAMRARALILFDETGRAKGTVSIDELLRSFP